MLKRLVNIKENEQREWIATMAKLLGSPYREGLLLDTTYLHRKGFAFELPEGFTLREEYQNAAIMLLGTADWRDFQPNISIKLLDRDEDLLDMGREQIEELYRHSIAQYQPGTFDYIDHDGVEMLALTYTQGRGDKQLYFQQALFNAAESCFIITMTTTSAEAEAADKVFADFITSLTFEAPIPKEKDADGKD